MIPRDYVTHWRTDAPWATDAQVEQDLVISRGLVEIFRVPDIASRLAFRGATALYKLHLKTAPRYLEDIDLVQVRSEPIGKTLDQIRSVLDSWLGDPQWELKRGVANLVYRFESEDEPPTKLRLKIEINTREHFSELGLETMNFAVDSPWFVGSAEVTTYALEGGHSVSRAQFEANLHEKQASPDFGDDLRPLLRAGVAWDLEASMTVVLERFVALLPGDPWKGSGQGVRQ